MIRRNDPESLLKEIVKLDTVEFLGVCTVLGIDIYEEKEEEEEKGEDNVEVADEGATAKEIPKKPKLKPRNFTDIWCDLCDKIWGLSRRRRKNLARLVRAATKKEK